MSSDHNIGDLPVGIHQKWIEFINELGQLVTVKERHVNWQKQMINAGKGTLNMEKEVKTAEFKIRNYKSWPIKVAKAMCDNPELARKEPTANDINNRVFASIGLSKGIMERLHQYVGNGHIIDMQDMVNDITGQSSANTANNNNTNTTSGVVSNNAASNNAASGVVSNTTIDTTKIEAVPKNLAAEGDRPDGSDPMGQRIYDLRLITGFGPKQAAKMAAQGMTLDVLLKDWEKVKASGNDILMIERMPIPAGYSEATFNQLTAQRQHSLKYGAFQTVLATYSNWLPKLNHHQLIGVKYFKDIAQKIPRTEIQRMERLLKAVAKRLDGGKNKITVQCCGSYRRGRPRSGDIDCLMTHRDLATAEDVTKYNAEHRNILHLMVDALASEKCKGFLNDHLTEGGDTKYMGVCRLPPRCDRHGQVIESYDVYRRIDIRFVPYNSFGTALLYFTGSRDFNTQMRNVALKKGLTLSEYGLFKLVADPKTKRWARLKTGGYKKGDQLPTPTEEDVFRVLDMDYKTPTERDI